MRTTPAGKWGRKEHCTSQSGKHVLCPNPDLEPAANYCSVDQAEAGGQVLSIWSNLVNPEALHCVVQNCGGVCKLPFHVHGGRCL